MKVAGSAREERQTLTQRTRSALQTSHRIVSPQVFSVTLKRLKATDIDQEVKERAISCMGHMVCHLGDQLGAELQGVLAIFLERLKNEITRLTAVRTITLISASPLKVQFDCFQRTQTLFYF